MEKIHKKASNRNVTVHNAPSVHQIQDLLLTIPSVHQDIIQHDVTHLMLLSVKEFATKTINKYMMAHKKPETKKMHKPMVDEDRDSEDPMYEE